MKQRLIASTWARPNPRTLMDIRDMDARKLMASGRPGDLALAMLAGGGPEQVLEIAKFYKNEFVQDAMQHARASMLRGQLATKFGRLPKWVDERLEAATSGQIERWCKKLLIAETLEGVLGKAGPSRH